jgi:hypothetical protein
MSRRVRALLVLCATFALLGLTALPLPVLALGESQVTLSCNDGTELNLDLDAASLAALRDSIAAMALYPAGMTCTVAATPILGMLGAGVAFAGNQRYDYVVGGGQQGTPPCDYNFAIQAHVETGANNTDATGHFNVTIPATCPPSAPIFQPNSQLTVEINCLTLTSSNTAVMSGIVQRAEGSLGAEGPFVSISASDNPDGLYWRTTGFSFDCATPTPLPIERGNITISSGS